MGWFVFCAFCDEQVASSDDGDEYGASDPADVAEWASEGGCPSCGHHFFQYDESDAQDEL
jgi:hypothetical protein